MPTINAVDEERSIVSGDFTAASSGGDSFVNTKETFLLIQNTGGSNRTVTIAAAGQCDQGFLHSLVLTVAPGLLKTRLFPQSRFGSKPNVTYDAVTDLSLVAVRGGSYEG